MRIHLQNAPFVSKEIRFLLTMWRESCSCEKVKCYNVDFFVIIPIINKIFLKCCIIVKIWYNNHICTKEWGSENVTRKRLSHSKRCS